MIQLGKPFEIEKRYIRKDGSAPVGGRQRQRQCANRRQGQIVVAVVVDITARKKVEASPAKIERSAGTAGGSTHESVKRSKRRIERRDRTTKGPGGRNPRISDGNNSDSPRNCMMGFANISPQSHSWPDRSGAIKNHRVIDAKTSKKLRELVNNAASDTRNLSRALHRIDVDAAGLVTALEDLVDREMWRTPCRLQVRPSFHIDDDTAAAHLYRIAREAVINANKHAQAREIVVKLEDRRQGMV